MTGINEIQEQLKLNENGAIRKHWPILKADIKIAVIVNVYS